MTVLEEFECPNCGANVAPPKPGQTIKCPYCEAVLSEPERPEKVIVREVVRERVVERVEPETPMPDFRSSPNAPNMRRRVALVLGAFVLMVCGLIIASGEHGVDQVVAKQKAQDDCEKACKKRCEKRYRDALQPQEDAAALDDPTKIIDQQMASINAQSEETTCESNCVTQCM